MLSLSPNNPLKNPLCSASCSVNGYSFAALRPSEQIDSETHEPECHKHANRNETGTARIHQDLLVWDGVNDDGYFLVPRVVLVVVQTVTPRSPTIVEVLARLGVTIQTMWVCRFPLQFSLGLRLRGEVCAISIRGGTRSVSASWRAFPYTVASVVVA